MVRFFLVVIWAVVTAFSSPFPVEATPAQVAQEFKVNNPDIAKYDFARSYISALGYVNAINLRWRKSSPKKVYAGDDIKVMRGYVAFLIKDNADLRVAKNFLTKYLESKNLLIQKTAGMFIAACQTEIAINDKEREIWDQWFAIKSNHLDTKVNERAFIKAQEELSRQRKIARRGVIEASVFLAKVLRSERNANDKGHVLAVTIKEREKLLNYLESYAKDMIEWGLKPGQDYIQASVAVIREVLEDSIYTSIDE